MNLNYQNFFFFAFLLFIFSFRYSVLKALVSTHHAFYRPKNRPVRPPKTFPKIPLDTMLPIMPEVIWLALPNLSQRLNASALVIVRMRATMISSSHRNWNLSTASSASASHSAGVA